MINQKNHSITKLLLLTMLSISCITDVNAEAMTEVSFEQIDSYWLLDSPPYRPVSEFLIPLFSKVPKGETAEVFQSFIINPNGGVNEIKTISSSHDGLLVEYGKARINSFSFKPSHQNSENRPVRVIIRTYIEKLLRPTLYEG